MKKRKNVWLYITILILFTHSWCFRPKAWWKEATIGIMADSSEWEGLQGVLRSTYEKVVRTPQKEKRFTLIHVPESDFERYTKFRYLILLATLGSEGKVGQMVNQVISDPKIMNGIQEGEYYIFVQKDQWASDQLMVILVSKDIQTLREKIENNGKLLYDIFEKDFVNRLTKDILKGRYHKKFEKRLLSSYNWTLQVQQDYFIANELPKQGYIWFRRLNPERWISVRWISDADTSYLNPNWITTERNRIGKQYYDGHQIMRSFFFSHPSTFLGRPAQITTGLWGHETESAGGPFLNYTFFDASTNSIYMIDLALFAPHREKLPLLRRMEIIAKSFRTVFDEKNNNTI